MIMLWIFILLPSCSLGNCTLITSNGFAWTHSKLIEMLILKHNVLQIQWIIDAVTQLHNCFHHNESNSVSYYFS